MVPGPTPFSKLWWMIINGGGHGEDKIKGWKYTYQEQRNSAFAKFDDEDHADIADLIRDR
jgi:hypothetical protein